MYDRHLLSRLAVSFWSEDGELPQDLDEVLAKFKEDVEDLAKDVAQEYEYDVDFTVEYR
jgi:hypothetical protein